MRITKIGFSFTISPLHQRALVLVATSQYCLLKTGKIQSETVKRHLVGGRLVDNIKEEIIASVRISPTAALSDITSLSAIAREGLVHLNPTSSLDHASLPID